MHTAYFVLFRTYFIFPYLLLLYSAQVYLVLVHAQMMLDKIVVFIVH